MSTVDHVRAHHQPLETAEGEEEHVALVQPADVVVGSAPAAVAAALRPFLKIRKFPNLQIFQNSSQEKDNLVGDPAADDGVAELEKLGGRVVVGRHVDVTVAHEVAHLFGKIAEITGYGNIAQNSTKFHNIRGERRRRRRRERRRRRRRRREQRR